MTDEKTARYLADLATFGRQAEQLVDEGHEAYMADTFDGERSRAFGERIILNIATVAERLPDTIKEAHPSVEWNALREMRNIIAHVHDGVDAEFVWRALAHRVPAMIAELVDDEA